MILSFVYPFGVYATAANFVLPFKIFAPSSTHSFDGSLEILKDSMESIGFDE